jgi:DegV family protein with EDD domain
VARIKVITDSACDLPSNLVEEHGIGIVPLDVRLGEWKADEMKSVDPAEFWRRCAMTDALPETSSPSPGAFAESFARAADEGCPSVVCLTLSADLSGTYQAARLGAEEVRGRVDVRVVDTRTVSVGEALVVLKTARVGAATNNLDLAEAAARAVVPNVHVYCTLDTLDNVKKGGRIGAARATLGSLLSIKPVLEIRDGVVRAEARQRTRARSLQYLVDLVKGAGKLEALAVAHAAAVDLEPFLDMLASVFPREDTLVSYLGPVIGAHGGPGCLGVAYLPAGAA